MPASPRQSVPASVYARVEEAPGTILLHGASRNNPKHDEPWTRLFTAPLHVLTAYETAEVPALFAAIEAAVAQGHTAAGFVTYECGAAFEAKAGMRAPRPGMPLAWFGIYDKEREGGEQGREGATEQESALAAEFALSESAYARRIEQIHEWIRAGDVYQLNFTAPWRIQAPASVAALYAQLWRRQPAQYGAWLHWQPGRHILSFSPELFFRVDHVGGTRRITARPMKGTAPRGRTTLEDRALSEWLRGDEKNRSENLMIVDLLRNDLGRVARTGSVRAETLFDVERLPTLWQMTSTITAELRDDAGYEAIFRALFPCGSITGAPKVRAMQLITELEVEPRGVYTGAIGFFSPRQTMFNVAIRTLELEHGRATMGTGSGIVIDSDAAAEYRECLLKAAFLSQSGQPAPASLALIETMLWKDGYPLLALHLDRLADSAAYFDFPCNRERIATALAAHARGFAPGVAKRVRLLLHADGALTITDAALAPASAKEGLRVRIARERTDPTDRFLFHKSTHRPLYGPAYEAAAHDGFADVLFFNLRGELTEGAISSVFLEKDGRWATPALECGVLPGVYRRHLLETRPGIEQRVLRKEDLRNADAVYLANGVRGLRRVEVVWNLDLPTA
jgi:para-aminobenzoate synthetase / 4-amino-4-deoxychorismate lyase